MRNVQVKVDGLMVVAGLAVAGATVLYLNRKAVGQAINPASDKNLAYSGVNAVGSELTNDENFSFGSWVYEITHPGRVQQEREALGL